MSYSSSVSKGFQPKFTPKLIQSSQHAQTSQGEPKVQKDYKAEYKKIKAILALLEASLADDELSVGKNHARNGEWIDITMKKLNILLSIDEDLDWQNYLKYINIDLKYVEEHRSTKRRKKDNPFVPASLDYDHEMVPKSKDWVERLNPDSKLPNINTGRILVLESEAINECLQLTKAPSDP
ncbi:hypothetical protein Tco_0506795 [Tanacetum coccineum]